MKGIKDIKDLLAALEAAEKKSDELDIAYEKEPENQALEAEWMDAYRAENEAFGKLKAAIASFTNGAIDEKAASALIMGKRTELKNLLSRV
jgi:hypothetical protein